MGAMKRAAPPLLHSPPFRCSQPKAGPYASGRETELWVVGFLSTLYRALHDGRPVFLVLTGACQFGHGVGGFAIDFYSFPPVHSALISPSPCPAPSFPRRIAIRKTQKAQTHATQKVRSRRQGRSFCSHVASRVVVTTTRRTSAGRP